MRYTLIRDRNAAPATLAGVGHFASGDEREVSARVAGDCLGARGWTVIEIDDTPAIEPAATATDDEPSAEETDDGP